MSLRDDIDVSEAGAEMVCFQLVLAAESDCALRVVGRSSSSMVTVHLRGFPNVHNIIVNANCFATNKMLETRER